MARRLDLQAIPHEVGAPLPVGDDTFYLCLICKTIVRSLPAASRTCSCGNVSIDVDSGRGGAKVPDQLLVLKINTKR